MLSGAEAPQQTAQHRLASSDEGEQACGHLVAQWQSHASASAAGSAASAASPWFGFGFGLGLAYPYSNLNPKPNPKPNPNVDADELVRRDRHLVGRLEGAAGVPG